MAAEFQMNEKTMLHQELEVQCSADGDDVNIRINNDGNMVIHILADKYYDDDRRESQAVYLVIKPAEWVPERLREIAGQMEDDKLWVRESDWA